MEMTEKRIARVSVPLEPKERAALDRLCALSKRTRPKEIAFLIVEADRGATAESEKAVA